MLIIYHGRRPYLPLLACATHLGLDISGAENFLPAALKDDWRAKPLRVIGKDSSGATVLCLIHGRHRSLYRRAIGGVAVLSGIPVRWSSIDDAIRDKSPAIKIGALLAALLPAIFHRSCRGRLTAAIRPHLLTR